ncbi:outer membrane protein [Pararhizobium sp.]|uniref:outer membrane protein n=1 Tax=Pararhizobium sp. TaxID=1977563 RepID=UPI00272858EB|nr:outer membrane beta-barrel protein [Pararhizobium sp.]MDO9415943.1 outer membrane beta-barrel protein [Pararhizobium sp.]
MKRILAAVSILLATSSVACAQDDWSGLYLGVNAGVGFGQFSHIHENDPDDPFFDERVKQSPNDFIGGGQIGYRHQFENIVLGAELSGGISALKGVTTFNSFGADRLREMELQNYVSATAELGVALGDGWLASTRAGFVGGSIRTFGKNLSRNIYGGDTSFENGWTVGLGVEKKLSDRVSFGVSYDYMRFNGSDRVVPCINAGCDVGFSNVEADVHTVRARLNFIAW